VSFPKLSERKVSVEGLELLGVLPEDDTVLTRDEQGVTRLRYPANSALSKPSTTSYPG